MRGVGRWLAVLAAAFLLAAGAALAGRMGATPTRAAGTTTVTTPGATTVMTSSTGTTTLTIPGDTYTYTTPDPPDAPQLREIFAGDQGSLVLNWWIPADNGSKLEGYNVYRGTSSGPGKTLLATVPTHLYDTSVYYVDDQVEAGTTYYYEVSAFNAIGEGPLSNELSRTAGTPDPPDPPLLYAAITHADSVELNWEVPWNGGSEITAYRIYRGAAPDQESFLAATEAFPPVYFDTRAVPGTRYYYKVSAVNSAGEGPLSNELSGIAGPGDVPGKPALSASRLDDGAVQLEWTTPDDYGDPIEEYVIYRGTSSGGETVLLHTGSAGNSYVDTTASPDTAYYYQVAGKNSFGEGARSDEVWVGPRGALFAPYAVVPNASSSDAVAIGDVTGDGLNDMVLTTGYDNDPANDFHLFVYAQGPGGTLSAPVSYATAGSYSARLQSVAVGDVTGDGRADVVVAVDGSGIQLFPQTAAGSLGAPAFTALANSLKIRLGHLDGDTTLDVAGIGWGTNTVSVLLNSGGGSFAAPVTYPAQHSGYDDLEVGDVTSDGRDDLIVMSGQTYATPNISVVRQLAGGGFGTAATYSLGTNILTHGIAVGDVTGDRRNDVVASYGGNRPSSTIAVLGQTDSEALGLPTRYPSYDLPGPVEVGDFDLDGDVDVVTLHGGWSKAGVYLRGGSGILEPEALFPIPYTSFYNPHGLAVGDVNGDGSPDVVIADGNGLVVLRNAEAGTPPPPPPVPPGAPTLDSATPGNGTVSLSWSAPAWTGGAPIDEYRIYRDTTSGGAATFLTAVASDVSSYQDTTVTNGTTYYYRVTAVGPGGVSSLSNERSATPRTVPGAPTLNAPTAGNATVGLSWGPPASNGGASITAYKLYRGTSPDAETLYATLGNVTSYSDTGVPNGTTYYYKVLAANSAGDGPLSNEQSATPRVPDSTPPTKPANLKLAVAGTNQLVIYWSPATDNVGVDHYEIVRGGVVVGTAAATEFDESGLAAGTSFTYQVRAVDASGNKSALSNSVGAKTIAQSTSSTGTLAGAVFTAAGAPLANVVVKVTLPNGSTKNNKTNASGAWKISNLAPGSYSLTANASGYPAKTFTMTAVAGKTVLAVTTFG